jgi:hypothetical protein
MKTATHWVDDGKVWLESAGGIRAEQIELLKNAMCDAYRQGCTDAAKLNERVRQEAEPNAEKLRAVDDMHGWNFFKGKCAGATAMDICILALRDSKKPEDFL